MKLSIYRNWRGAHWFKIIREVNSIALWLGVPHRYASIWIVLYYR